MLGLNPQMIQQEEEENKENEEVAMSKKPCEENNLQSTES